MGYIWVRSDMLSFNQASRQVMWWQSPLKQRSSQSEAGLLAALLPRPALPSLAAPKSFLCGGSESILPEMLHGWDGVESSSALPSQRKIPACVPRLTTVHSKTNLRTLKDAHRMGWGSLSSCIYCCSTSQDDERCRP